MAETEELLTKQLVRPVPPTHMPPLIRPWPTVPFCSDTVGEVAGLAAGV